MRCRWDEIGKRYYEAGADRGVVYPVQSDGLYTKGAPWNGLIGVTESPSGAEAKPLWANNHKYLTLISAEEYGGTIKAYTEAEAVRILLSDSSGQRHGERKAWLRSSPCLRRAGVSDR